SSTRIKVEHILSRRKKYAIASEVYRNRDEEYDAAMNVVSGLVNLGAFDRIFESTGLAIQAEQSRQFMSWRRMLLSRNRSSVDSSLLIYRAIGGVVFPLV
ncbi:MAG TPA: hypothetical protein VLJ61_05740, partial [Pyrinomonadaceae bacterium]|nr:hypothetical protein [Pyrinomonadaceae bacterium]